MNEYHLVFLKLFRGRKKFLMNGLLIEKTPLG